MRHAGAETGRPPSQAFREAFLVFSFNSDSSFLARAASLKLLPPAIGAINPPKNRRGGMTPLTSR